VRDSNVLIQVELSALTRADLAVLSELKRKHPELADKISRAALKILFREKRVRLVPKSSESQKSTEPNSRRALSASDNLFPGTHAIEIQDWNPEADLSPEPSHGPDTEMLPVLFENEDLLILHKSSGMPSVPLQSHETRTAVSSALRHLQTTSDASGKISDLDTLQSFIQIGKSSHHPLEAGLLHRLDTGTSGVLAFAKNQAEFDRIRSLWKTDQVRKFYRAIVELRQSGQSTLPPKNAQIPELKKLPFTITTPIGHDPKSSKRMLALDPVHSSRNLNIRGKPLDAITHILGAKLFEQGASSLYNQLDNQLWELQLEIETGVMHQIRVHLAFIGLPILGDPLYGPPSTSQRLFLHHERLELPLKTGTILKAQAPLPQDWLARTPSSTA
jgi:23S rRNA pseudouridine1911/1915/1917 synthase